MGLPNDKSLPEKIADYFKQVEKILQFIPALAGGSFLVIFKNFNELPVIFCLAILFIIISAIWIAWRHFKKPRPVIINPQSASAYIRGLKPFEKGDKLLGDDSEQKKFNSILKATEFRFGYISGEAGSGKTSFIRSVKNP